MTAETIAEADAAASNQRDTRSRAAEVRMILVTRLDGSELYVNAEFVQSVQSTPDTHIVLINGTSYVVKEPDTQVVARIIEYRRAIGLQPASYGHLKAVEG
jgi:flagellar protein FlbD